MLGFQGIGMLRYHSGERRQSLSTFFYQGAPAERKRGCQLFLRNEELMKRTRYGGQRTSSAPRPMIALKIRSLMVFLGPSPPLLPPFFHLASRLLHLASRLHRRDSIPCVVLSSQQVRRRRNSRSRLFTYLSDPMVTNLVACDGRNLLGVLGLARKKDLFPSSYCGEASVLSRWLTLPTPRASGQAEKICGDPVVLPPVGGQHCSISVSVLDLGLCYTTRYWNSSFFEKRMMCCLRWGTDGRAWIWPIGDPD
ncbi:hypothetical protein B0T21DRAFT_117893 [Apiosordaria backusii]|uniref:Uncharacterized protein n=1 Tax=Apiosordaria backusii TaxID=314023 RepID=A0AA40ELS4_9PEZI|nr:hypothetical protein B0T21DRAFT_117893 [Apiosordaria backusii]